MPALLNDTSESGQHTARAHRVPGTLNVIFGEMPAYSAFPRLDIPDIVLLRLLGRLELLTTREIHGALFPHLSRAAVRCRLRRLVEAEMLWVAKTRVLAITKTGEYARTNRTSALAFGLSTAGKEILAAYEIEPDPQSLEQLKHREARGRKPATQTMPHDLQVAWWCLNMISFAARHKHCHGIYVQVEFTAKFGQRMDALVILRMNPKVSREIGSVYDIPFFDGTLPADGDIDIRLALEVDKGSEPLRVLLEKGEAYRNFTATGVYTQTIGGPVLPVFIAQTELRAKHIAEEYRSIWPEGWGVMTTPLRAHNEQHGVLWGDYRSMTTGKYFLLMTDLAVQKDGRVVFVPLYNLDEWAKASVPITAPDMSAEQVNGRKGGKARGAMLKNLPRSEPKRRKSKAKTE